MLGGMSAHDHQCLLTALRSMISGLDHVDETDPRDDGSADDAQA
jgi:hypothetical protein